jgi:hypothetical protein
MPGTAVYIERRANRCMAHVLQVPGCFVRAPTIDDALAALPAAVGQRAAWLRSAGFPVELEVPLDFSVEEIVEGTGPFDPGDPAAIFSPEQQPLTREESDVLLGVLERSRAGLMDLIADLPDEVLDWSTGGGMSVREILRHIGNAEEGYSSKLVDPDRLPEEWDHDDAMPIREFLEMERGTAVAILRDLDDSERSSVHLRLKSDGVTEEPWSARKVLRRFLEHEWEHYRHIKEVLQAHHAQASGERKG